MCFNLSFSDIKKILQEVHKHYILIERELPEDAPQELVVDMHKYVARLQELLWEKFEINISYKETAKFFKECLGSATKEETNYIKLTHHSWKE